MHRSVLGLGVVDQRADHRGVAHVADERDATDPCGDLLRPLGVHVGDHDPAPARARRSHSARPIPWPPPVTTAHRSARSMRGQRTIRATLVAACGVLAPMDAPAQTPGDHAARDPDRPAIVMAEAGDVVTYAELESRSARAARALRAAGLHPGDHVALLLDNRPAMLELAWAAQRSGLYFTPVNTRLAADEAAYVVDDCGATVLFAAASVARLAGEVRDRTPRVTRFVAVDGEIDGFESLRGVRRRGRRRAPRRRVRGLADALLVGDDRTAQGRRGDSSPASRTAPTTRSARCSRG